VEYELRRNRIRPGGMDDFLDAWLAQVPPMRRQFGFQFLGAWVADDKDEFVWIMGYDGPDGFDAADARYYASPARAALDPDPAQWFETAEQLRLRAILPTD
jgi:hypothetical protein